MFYRTIALLVFCAGVLLGALGEHARAQDTVGVKVGPALTELTVDPGTVLTEQVSVTNVTDLTQTYTFRTRNVKSVAENGTPVFAEGVDESGGLASWIELVEGSITVAPGETKFTSYRITVPSDASPGGHYGGVFVVRDADPIEGQGASVGYQVGALIILTVSGDVVEKASIREFSSTQSIYTEADVAFKLRMLNEGTVHVRPVGVVSILDMLGREVADVKVNDSGGMLIPKAERTYPIEWKDDAFRIGRFKAEVTLAFGENGSQNAQSDLTFWIIPYKELGIAVAVLLGLALLAYGFVRLTVRRALRKAGHAVTTVRTEQTLGARMAKTAVTLLTIILFALLVIGLFYS